MLLSPPCVRIFFTQILQKSLNLLQSVKTFFLHKILELKVIKKGFQVDLTYLLSNLAEIWHRSQFRSADFEFELKDSI